MVMQPDQTPVVLHYRNNTYRQSVTLFTVFNPQCMALDPKDVSTYEEIAPYSHSNKSIMWLLIGISVGILTNMIGDPGIWPYAFVVFTFALATLIFKGHRSASQMLYQITLADGRRLIAAVDAEYVGEMARQFPNAKENVPDGLYSDNLSDHEELHVEKIRYGLVTATASASLFQMTQNLKGGIGYDSDLATMLTIGIIPILIGLIAVSIFKITRVGRKSLAS